MTYSYNLRVCIICLVIYWFVSEYIGLSETLCYVEQGR